MGHMEGKDNMTKYHVTYKWADGTIAIEARKEGVSSYIDKDIQKAKLGEGRYLGIEECTLERCNICAKMEYALQEIFKVGKTIIATSGCYSDYSLTGLYVVLKPFAPESLTIEQAITQGFIMAQDYTEWWTDD